MIRIRIFNIILVSLAISVNDNMLYGLVYIKITAVKPAMAGKSFFLHCVLSAIFFMLVEKGCFLKLPRVFLGSTDCKPRALFQCLIYAQICKKTNKIMAIFQSQRSYFSNLFFNAPLRRKILCLLLVEVFPSVQLYAFYNKKAATFYTNSLYN